MFRAHLNCYLNGRRQAGFARSPMVAGLAALAILALVVIALSFESHPAPEIDLTSIKGEKITTEKLHGKVVLVNFWSTSCAVCVHEMPQMVDTYRRFSKDGLEFVAIAMPDDAPSYVVNYAETRQLPFYVALDGSGKASRDFGDVQATPTTFLIDKRGRIIKRYVGEPDFAELNQLIQTQLAA